MKSDIAMEESRVGLGGQGYGMERELIFIFDTVIRIGLYENVTFEQKFKIGKLNGQKLLNPNLLLLSVRIFQRNRTNSI